jgi:hypothetical protein
MAFLKAEKLPAEPIIISTYTGFVNAQDIREGVVEIARLSQTIEGRVYAIADVRTISSSFAEVLAILRDQSKGEAGTTTDPNLVVVLVGTDSMAKLYVSAMRNNSYGGVMVPMFATMEAALDSVRVMASNFRQTA